VAFFTDSFHEVNGVGLTSREFVAFAGRRSLPMLSVHAGAENRTVQQGSIVTCEFTRGPIRWQVEHDLAIDLLFLRHRARLRQALREFQPDLVHITGPGDAGILGAMLAYELKIPLAASWHTNLHEFAARRLAGFLRFLPKAPRAAAAAWAERASLNECVRFYRLAKILFAPNPELVDMLAQRTGRPAFLMQRGIDTALFSPVRRERADSTFVIGYVGRLSPEKNVRLLARVEDSLVAAGVENYRFLVVGEGSDRGWLRRTLRRAEFPGILRGEQLARAYASMDAFLFPSFTDTFGNVILEAMASGVPAVVASGGGPKFLVDHGKTGFVAGTEEEFMTAVLSLYRDRESGSDMRNEARKAAEKFSWDAVFQGVYNGYDACFRPHIRALSYSAAASYSAGGYRFRPRFRHAAREYKPRPSASGVR
jgi:glycosyltransferase involved in cell wall biosynthesis